MPKSSTIREEFQAIQTALEVLEPLEELQRKFAISMILARLGMADLPFKSAVGAGKSGGNGAGSEGGSSNLSGDATDSLSPKEFLKQKQPRTDLERFTCLAYYLHHFKSADQFSTRDITKLNGDAHGQDLANPAATAQNGMKQSKFFSNAGRGKKRITTLGEAVVEALPSAEKVKEVLAAARSRKRTRRGRKKAKG